MRQHTKIFGLLSMMAVVLLLASCATVQKGISSVSGKTGDVQSVAKVGKALRNSFKDITEEEEYYIGRAVAALIFSRYSTYSNNALTAYVNRIGNSVAAYSDRPETYGGYHFIILNTDEVNALAAPGGFVFITKGLIKRCRNEEMLGSILAHEIGHVTAKHGLQSIKKSRLIDAFKTMGQEASKRYGPQELAQLTSIFENVLGDIAENLIEKGYDRKYEYEADKLGAVFAARTGYSPQGLLDFLQTMVDEAGKSEDKGWFKTHPSASDRMKRAGKEIGKLKTSPAIQSVRTSRFQQAVKSLK